MHCSRAPAFILILSCFITYLDTKLIRIDRGNHHLRSDMSISYTRRKLLDLGAENIDIKRSGVVWHDQALKESLSVTSCARSIHKIKRTRRGTKGYKRANNTRIRCNIRRPQNNQPIKRDIINPQHQSSAVPTNQPNLLL